jgi:hypothetical protein
MSDNLSRINSKGNTNLIYSATLSTENDTTAKTCWIITYIKVAWTISGHVVTPEHRSLIFVYKLLNINLVSVVLFRSLENLALIV